VRRASEQVDLCEKRRERRGRQGGGGGYRLKKWKQRASVRRVRSRGLRQRYPTMSNAVEKEEEDFACLKGDV